MTKEDFLASLRQTASEILDEIIAPVCSVSGVTANIYTATISNYDSANPENRKRILEKILEKYGVDRNGLEAIQDYPLALIALYILDKEKE